MAAKNELSFGENSHVTKEPKITKKKKKKKNPDGISQWDLAQSRRTWIHLRFWNKIWQKLFCLEMATKASIVILCNNANLC